MKCTPASTIISSNSCDRVLEHDCGALRASKIQSCCCGATSRVDGRRRGTPARPCVAPVGWGPPARRERRRAEEVRERAMSSLHQHGPDFRHEGRVAVAAIWSGNSHWHVPHCLDLALCHVLAVLGSSPSFSCRGALTEVTSGKIWKREPRCAAAWRP